MIELKNGRIAAGERVVIGDLSFVAPAGKITCLVGPRGCGKTLLVRSLLGLWPLEKGFATLQGEPVTRLSAPWLRRLMVYVPQELPDSLSDALDALDEGLATGRRAVVADDPFVAMSEERALLLADRLQALAGEGRAVVVACGEADVSHFDPTVTLVCQIENPSIRQS